MEDVVEVKFVGTKPTLGTEFAAAFDLYAGEDVQIIPGEVKMVSTKTFIEIPNDCEALLNVRSGLSSKGIMLANGTGIIDADYRGEIKMLLYNGNVKSLLFSNVLGISKGVGSMLTGEDSYGFSKIPGLFEIKKCDRIGQIRVRRIPKVNFIEVDVLNETERGEGGFGSTGV